VGSQSAARRSRSRGGGSRSSQCELGRRGVINRRRSGGRRAARPSRGCRVGARVAPPIICGALAGGRETAAHSGFGPIGLRCAMRVRTGPSLSRWTFGRFSGANGKVGLRRQSMLALRRSGNGGSSSNFIVAGCRGTAGGMLAVVEKKTEPRVGAGDSTRFHGSSGVGMTRSCREQAFDVVPL